MLEYILTTVVAGIIAMLFMGVFLIFRSIRERRLAFWQQRIPAASEEVSILSSIPRQNVKLNWSERMDRAFDLMLFRTRLNIQQDQAIASILLAGVVMGGILLVWQNNVWLAAIGLIFGMSLTLGIYLFLQSRWRSQIQNQLPDTIFLLSRSLRAGLSLEQAMENVSKNGSEPLASEFQRAVEQMKLGLTAPIALKGFADRIQLADVDVFVTVVTLHRNIGGNLTMLLDRVANGIRDRNLFRGYVKTATALARVTAVALASGAPLLFLGYAIWQPEFIDRFLESSSGMRALLSAVALEVIGIIWLTFLLRDKS